MPASRGWWATGLGLVALFIALAFWNPAAAGGPDLCLFHRATGVACPGCGLTRSVAALGRGDLAGSWRWHPLGAILAVETGLLWVLVRVAPGGLFRLAPRIALATGTLLLLAWIVRLATGTLPV